MNELRKTPYELTPRDASVLRWMAEQYGVRFDLLAVLLGRHSSQTNGAPVSRARVGQIVDRWEESGLVIKRRTLGAIWVTPTRECFARVGLPRLDPWAIPATRVDHQHAVSVLRLWFEVTGSLDGREWVCERLIYRRGKAGDWPGRTPDAIVERETPGGVEYAAIEVELTHKTVARYAEILRTYPAGIVGLAFFVRDEQFRALLLRHFAQADELIRRPGNYAREVQLLPTLDQVAEQARRKGGLW